MLGRVGFFGRDGYLGLFGFKGFSVCVFLEFERVFYEWMCEE